MQKLKEMRAANPDNEVYFIDIGANFGWYTLAAASLGFKTIAFEPLPENVKYLKLNLQANQGFSDLVTVYDIALGESDYDCNIYSWEGNYLDGMIRCENDTLEGGANLRAIAKVTTLDKYIDALPLMSKVGAIKIDTEGMDYFIIKGGYEFLQKYKPPYIQSEYNPSMMINKGYQPQDHIDQFYQLGYIVHK